MGCTAPPGGRFLKCRQFIVNLYTKLTRLPEGLERFLKKGKSSEFNPRNDGQVKSSPAGKVWSHESSNLYPKIGKIM